MIVDCIADLHGNYPELEGGDLLIVAGDLTRNDDPKGMIDFYSWIDAQDYKKKIVIGGNHDNYFYHCCSLGDTKPFSLVNTEYLCDSGTEFEWDSPSEKEWGSNRSPISVVPYEKKKLKIWGSPWTLWFPGINPKCKAFTGDENDLRLMFDAIPHDIDILVTHGPPYGIFDKTARNELVGSKELLIKVAEIKPIIHCFGHIHEQGGKEMWVPWKNGTRFINCSYVNERYQPVNKPIRIIL